MAGLWNGGGGELDGLRITCRRSVAGRGGDTLEYGGDTLEYGGDDINMIQYIVLSYIFILFSIL